MTAPPVDLLVNCWEGTYRELLAPGRLAGIAEQNRFRFARRTLLVNNVTDRADAERRAAERVRDGELDAVFHVAEHLDTAFAATGLRPEDLAPIPQYTDWALVATVLPGPDHFLHWDPEIRLREPADWVSPSLALMARDPRVLVANPNWVAPTLARHTIERAGDFALGHGFSDQVYLARRSELARPIYGARTLARLRFPLAHLGHIYEARLDAHLRCSDRLRATYLRATYEHPVAIGGAYPPRGALAFARNVRNRLVEAGLQRVPPRLRPRDLRYF